MQQLFLSIPPLFSRKQRQEDAVQRQRADEQSPFATMHPYRQPTFTYSPPTCRRFSTFPRSLARSPNSATSLFAGSPSSMNSTPCTLTPDSESLASPTSSYFPTMPELTPGSTTAAPEARHHAQQPQRYVSFPDLDTLCDDCWVDVRVEPKGWCPTDIQMEEYDEMLVGDVRLAYS